MNIIPLIIEIDKNGKYWGRIQYESNLLIDKAGSVEILKKRMKKLLSDFHELDVDAVQFELQYDLTALFDQNSFLNVSAIAARAGINPSLMRQYVSGTKYPSPDRVKAIEKVIREIGRELSRIKVVRGSTKTVRSKTKNLL